MSENGGRDNRRPSPPRRRVVLLGASNLTRGISTVVETARLTWDEPIDLMAAHGHGRSYGIETWVLGRGLPGIASCGLWDDLAARPPGPTAALVTDIGNDILYGVDVPRIVQWVERCVARLQPVCERLVVTQLPLENVDALEEARYRLMRSLLFPRCRMTLGQVVDRAGELAEQVERLADQYDATLVTLDPAWYGFDPIHIRMTHWRSAWRKILSAWRDEAAPLAKPSLRRGLYLRALTPHQRHLLLKKQHRRQPAGALADGTTISFY